MSDVRDFRPILINLCREEWAPFLPTNVSPLTAVSIVSGRMNNEVISDPSFDALPRDERAKKLHDFAVAALKNLCFPPPADDDVVKVVVETIVEITQADEVYGLPYIGAFHNGALNIDGPLPLEPIVRAVLDKLRAEGVIR